MQVDFKDCEFGKFAPDCVIIVAGKEYHAVTVYVVLDDGSREEIVIADIGLEQDMAQASGGVEKIDNPIDDGIAYYASPDENMYDALRNIYEEEESVLAQPAVDEF